MECFQHYTYVKSGCQAICCDLQGVYSDGKYILTDPAINSRSRSFDNTDMGLDGINEILSRHKCNMICKDLDLKNNKKYNPDLQPVWNSTSKRRSHTTGI